MKKYFGLWVILAAYLAIAGLFALRTPAWQAPDEPAHYHYIAQVASGTLIPVIAPGDWDNDYLEALKSERFHPDLLDNLATVRYENHQPPLYYWLATPVYWLTGGSLIAIRLYSLLWGLITIFMAWRITKLVFPALPHLALAAAAWVAFLPQHVAILASVNNDALAGALIATTLYFTLRYVQGASIKPALLGVFIGLIFITKTTGYFMAGVVLLALCLRQFNQSNKIPWRALIEFGIPAGIFALFWWGRNILVYGFPDFLGLRAHDAIVVGQLRTVDFIAQMGQSVYWERFLTTTFNSFWGQFGWMGVPLYDVPTQGANVLYPAFLGLVILAILGLLLSFFINKQAASAYLTPQPPHSTDLTSLLKERGSEVPLPMRWGGSENNVKQLPLISDTPVPSSGKANEVESPLYAVERGQGVRIKYRNLLNFLMQKQTIHLILFMVLLLTVLMFVYYNSVFVQFQGRYLFTGLMPLAVYGVYGLDVWRRLFLARFSWAKWLILIPMLLLALLDIYLIWRVLPGALSYA